MKNSIFLGFCTLMLLASCSKEQHSVDKLEGSWHLLEKKIYLDNVDQEDTSLAGMDITYTFESCDLKNVEFCNGNIRTVQGTSQNDAAMMYKFSDDGKTLIIDNDGYVSTSNDRINAKVIKLNKEEFVFEYEVIIVGTQRTVFTLNKQ